MSEVFLERLRERAASLQRASEALTGEPEEFLALALDNCNHFALLSVTWEVIMRRFHQGGLPAKLLVSQCDLLLYLVADLANNLKLVVQQWQVRQDLDQIAREIHTALPSVQARLAGLDQDVRKVRDWAATPPRISADAEVLKRRILQADERKEWVRLADVIPQMRQ
jgi:hypothetical protein